MEEKQPETANLREEVKDIKRLMERSSRFISLSGLIGVAAGICALFAIAFLSSFYLTWRKARKQRLSLWDYTSRRLFWNMVIPLVAGGCFIIGMLQYDEWRFVAPACLVFYGLALINASKYTLTDIRYLGYFEIVLGIINMWWIGYGLYFWAIGFGILHIIYGLIMWWKYEREPGTGS
jgi:hypothetical protein